jgi:hypothetical protein
VLEKQVRQKGKDTATVQEMERLRASVLKEGGRKGNEAVAKAPQRVAPVKGGLTLKSSANLGGAISGPRSSGGSSRSAESSGEGVHAGGVELGKSVISRDLSKSDGIGPRGAAKKVWR